MKKSLVAIIVLTLSSLSPAWAGHFIDVLPPASTSGCVPVSNGYDYQCSNDTNAPTVKVGALSTTGAVTQSTSTLNGTLALYSQTIALLNALAPATTGQVVFCSDCTRSGICISSGVATGAWVVAASTAAAPAYTSIHCQ